ncbi:MAG: hydroxyisourate hydrolase [Rhodospirillaceae bacterium]|jgi:5-hydroxyisourate hydrolase|nr:hydroxyisourate hydrolase [Rhodospirillaceae bacterium]MBT5941268.1 hydroxyisourate hydrolase [Rhodospirillaceae bacterium]MBT7266914.1 hydroxyisourate hydrolase [Rhodospirillaceae bacterium]
MGFLTTHILDSAHGCPAAGVRVELYRISDSEAALVLEAVTNADGRCDEPLLEDADFSVGTYELRFHIGDYFAAKGIDLPSPAFLDVVPLRFGIAEPEDHYHVPLLVSPYSYSTYRGS